MATAEGLFSSRTTGDTDPPAMDTSTYLPTGIYWRVLAATANVYQIQQIDVAMVRRLRRLDPAFK